MPELPALSLERLHELLPLAKLTKRPQVWLTQSDAIDYGKRVAADARRKALEDAARVCDGLTTAIDHGGNTYRREAFASKCAAAIRALATKDAP